MFCFIQEPKDPTHLKKIHYVFKPKLMSYLLLINKVDKSYKRNFQELFMFYSFIKFNLKFIYQVDYYYMYIYQINMFQVVNV